MYSGALSISRRLFGDVSKIITNTMYPLLLVDYSNMIHNNMTFLDNDLLDKVNRHTEIVIARVNLIVFTPFSYEVFIILLSRVRAINTHPILKHCHTYDLRKHNRIGATVIIAKPGNGCIDIYSDRGTRAEDMMPFMIVTVITGTS